MRQEDLKRLQEAGSEYCALGIWFDYYYSGSTGAHFILYPEAHHTRAQIKASKNWLRKHRDVVTIITERVRG